MVRKIVGFLLILVFIGTAGLFYVIGNHTWVARISGRDDVSVTCIEPKELKRLEDRRIIRFECFDSDGVHYDADLMVPSRVARLVVLFAGYESRNYPETFLERQTEDSAFDTAILFVHYLADDNRKFVSITSSLRDIIEKREELLKLPIVARRLKREALEYIAAPELKTFVVGCSIGSLFAYATTVGERDAGIVDCLGVVRIDRLVVQALQYEIKPAFVRVVLGQIARFLFEPLSPMRWIESNREKPLLVFGLRGDYLIAEDEYEPLLAGHSDATATFFDGTHRMYLLSPDLQREVFREAEAWMRKK